MIPTFTNGPENFPQETGNIDREMETQNIGHTFSDKLKQYSGYVPHFWCPVVTLVTFSSNLSIFKRNPKKTKKVLRNPKKLKIFKISKIFKQI